MCTLRKPDDRREQHDRRLDEEVALLLNPRLIEVEHNGIRRFVGVRNIGHELRSNGIAAVRASRVVEVDDKELRSHLVFVEVTQQTVVCDDR